MDNSRGKRQEEVPRAAHDILRNGTEPSEPASAETIVNSKESVIYRLSETRERKVECRCGMFRGCLAKVIPPGGLVSTTFNFASVCIGAGILGLPAAANATGLIMAVLYNMLFALFTTYSLYCIAVQMEKHNFRSMESMSFHLFGPNFRYVAAAIRFTNSFGSCIAFVISVGDVFRSIMRGGNVPEFFSSKSGTLVVTSLIWLFCMLPLCIPRSVNALRYISTLAISFIVYLVVVIVVHSSKNGLAENVKNIRLSGGPDDEQVHLFGTGNEALAGPSVFLFAFLCQINSYEIYWAMPERSVSRFTLSASIAIGLCCILYVTTSIFGYLDFAGKTKGSVLLLYYPTEEPVLMVGYIGLVVKLCASYALVGLAARNTFYHMVGWNLDTLQFWKHCICATLLATASLIFGLFIPNVNTAFGFVGSLSGALSGFVIPSLFMMYGGNWSLKTVGWFHYILTYAVLVVGVILVVVGTTATIYSAASSP
ncbi:putative amino acid transporter [Trypanosoma vivax]|nr:putative amino acid transporter [Trypanosoma vivax]